MLTWLLMGLPVGITALVFSLALVTDPHDLIVRRITAPASLEQRGYPAIALADLLQDQVSLIMDGASTFHRKDQIAVGTNDTTADQFASIVNIAQPIEATQRLLGLVGHIADIGIVEHSDKAISVHLRILEGDYKGTFQMSKTTAAESPFEKTLGELARQIVTVAEPYAMASYLYKTAIDASGPPDFGATMAFLKQWLPNMTLQDRPWAHNLLGLIAARSKAPDLAVAQYREALSQQPDFALAHANWGRVLHDSGDLQGAIDHYRTALDLNPRLAIARVYLAEAQLAEASYAQALAQLDQARALAPELAQVYDIQATLYDTVGLPDQAARERQRAQLARMRQPRQTYYDAL